MVTAAQLASGAALAQPAPTDGSWLYAVLADRATATATEVSVPNKGSTVVAFTDAPRRSVDTEDVVDLASSWTERFGDVSPNAVLSWDEGRDDRAVTVTLGAPETRGGRVIFPYTVISGRVHDARGDEEPVELRLDRTMRDLRMFIDDGAANQCQDVNFDNATIKVSVVDDGSGDPIEGAQVQLFGTSSTTTPSVTGTTDAAGSVTFMQASTEILIQGFYRVIVTDPAYATSYVDQITACADQTVDVLARL
jgi:5-hydroxyisourate hydrolase-like protein (transthyretin family)